MRAIIKAGEPHALLNWKRDNAEFPENLKYGRANFPSEEVRCSLLTEQHYLCAYTLQRLKTPAQCEALEFKTAHSCHIEHLLPQCREKLHLANKVVKFFTFGEDIDYKNMVACYPDSRNKIHCDYGAKFKDDYDPYEDGLFVFPHAAAVEHHFLFTADGHISGQTPEGINTVNVLKLDHPELIARRAAAIDGAIRPRNKEISAAEARRLAKEIMQPLPDGSMRAFCVAIKQVAVKHAEKIEKRAQRLRGQRN
jgi:hypothetical protein